MTVDLRGFSHPASLLRERAQWRLSRVERERVQAQAALHVAQSALDQCNEAIDAAAAAMAGQALHAHGAEVHALHGGRIMQLLNQRSSCEAALEQCRHALERAEQRCIELQKLIQGFDHVHAQALKQHSDEQSRTHWRSLDDHVMTRTQWLATRATRESDHANR